MKNLMATFIGLIIIGFFPWQSHSDEKDQLELAFQLVEKTRMSKIFVDLSEAFMMTYFERYDATAEQGPVKSNPLRKIFSDEVYLGEDELKWMLAEIYAVHFNEKELRAILAFFDSPSGNAWLEKKLLIQTESEQVGLEWGRLLTQRVLKKFETQSGEKLK